MGQCLMVQMMFVLIVQQGMRPNWHMRIFYMTRTVGSSMVVHMKKSESDTMKANGPCCIEYEGHTNTCHTNQPQNQSSIPSGIVAQLGPQVSKHRVSRDALFPSKSIGFLNHHPKEFTFIGSDRAPQHIDSIDAYSGIAEIIRNTGVPNYAQARIPLISGLNINEWERELRDYHDPFLLQYLKFGFPLSLVHSHELSNNTVSNH